MLKSKFEAMLSPCNSDSMVAACLADLKRRFPKADHYPYATMIDGKAHSSDDGEPGGSGGRPLIQLLETSGINSAFLGVARYFGGTKLGVGNLRRCFVTSAQEAIDKGDYGIVKTVYRYELAVSYADYQTLQRLSGRLGFSIASSSFEEEVKVELTADSRLDDAWVKMGFYIENLAEPSLEEALVKMEKSK